MIFKLGYLIEVKKKITRVALEKKYIEEVYAQELKKDILPLEKEIEKLQKKKKKTEKEIEKQIKLFREVEEIKEAKKNHDLAKRKLFELGTLYKSVKRNLWK